MKRGFTVIELLAIIVIVAIIALISVPIITNVINSSQKKAAIDEAYIFIDAVESNTGLGALDKTSGYLELEDTCYDVVTTGLTKDKTDQSEEILKLRLKGTPPRDGIICLESSKVSKAILAINNYRVTITNGEVTDTKKIKSSDDMRTELLYNNIKVGDYIKMTPSPDTSSYEDVFTGSTNGLPEAAGSLVYGTTSRNGYKVTKEKTGAKIDQVINPTELKLWRVIRINDDNSIDAVSEYTSSYPIYFGDDIESGGNLTGYKNYVGVLNEIASQYENDNFTVGSRIAGYKEGCQTEYLDSVDVDSNTPETKDNDYESVGGGDVCYTEDLDLIYKSIGKYSAYGVGTKSITTYYLGSRYFKSTNTKNIRYVWTLPEYDKYLGTFGYIRPIITINGYLTDIQGDGTSSKPFLLQ